MLLTKTDRRSLSMPFNVCKHVLLINNKPVYNNKHTPLWLLKGQILAYFSNAKSAFYYSVLILLILSLLSHFN